MQFRLVLIFLIFLFACNRTAPPTAPKAISPAPEIPKEILEPADPDFDMTNWVDMNTFAPEIRQHIYYATAENFTKKVLYPCGRCFLRPIVAKALVQVQEDLESKGFGLLVYDCYRPLDVQWKMWEATPDKRYVSDPNKGSMHNRGVAVDLTLVDAAGKELDMGTPYDFFGKAAWPEYTDLASEILERRQILQNAMLSEGFQSIRTEWWHYSYPGTGSPIAEAIWPCR